MASSKQNAQSDAACYPPPESQGGWRYLVTPEEIRTIAGMDAGKLDILLKMQEYMHGGDSWSIVVIRHGYLVREAHTFNVLQHTRFDIWSGTKSFTGTAWGLLLEQSRQGELPSGKEVALDSPAYEYLPQGQPLTDSRKAKITIAHLLTMTSGIPGVDEGVIGMPTVTGAGHFEHALGKCPNRYGQWVARLTAEPGKKWDYSDPAFAHLSLLFYNITGLTLYEYLHERILRPIGIETMSWDVAGGSGFIGPFSNAHTGVHISARELARFGYLLLRGGVWEGRPLIPRWWIDLATTSSQEMNPDYGYTFWVNTRRTKWLRVPSDAFSLEGYRSNHCYVIPSLDLVVARVGSGPPMWREPELIEAIVGAVVDI